jgi:hypothetical protein
LVSDADYEAFVALKETELGRIGVEIGAHAKADNKTYREGLRIIELFPKLPKFMEFGADLHAKARLAKMVLSNLLLTNGRLEYDYQNPFDTLLKLSEGKGWW